MVKFLLSSQKVSWPLYKCFHLLPSDKHYLLRRHSEGQFLSKKEIVYTLPGQLIHTCFIFIIEEETLERHSKIKKETPPRQFSLYITIKKWLVTHTIQTLAFFFNSFIWIMCHIPIPNRIGLLSYMRTHGCI